MSGTFSFTFGGIRLEGITKTVPCFLRLWSESLYFTKDLSERLRSQSVPTSRQVGKQNGEGKVFGASKPLQKQREGHRGKWTVDCLFGRLGEIEAWGLCQRRFSARDLGSVHLQVGVTGYRHSHSPPETIWRRRHAKRNRHWRLNVIHVPHF